MTSVGGFGPILLLLGTSLLLAVCTELGLWYTTLRKAAFTEQVAAVKRTETSLEDEKRKDAERQAKTRSNAQGKSLAKNEPDATPSARISKLETRLANQLKNPRLQLLWGQLYGAIGMLALLPIVSRIWKGQAIGLLPFRPMSFFKGVLQQGLDGREGTLYDCSALSFWMMSLQMWRGILKQVLPQPGLPPAGLFG